MEMKLDSLPEARIFVVDDDEAVRDSLAMMLSSGGFKVDSFASAESFLAGFSPNDSGCLLTDVRMPGMDGLELMAELKRRGAILPVILVTGHGDVAMAVSALKGGAADFIEKPIEADLVFSSVRSALAKGDHERREIEEKKSIAVRFADLTPREREVMELMVVGEPNKIIAANLDISVRTVEIHRARVMEKTGARSLSELVRMALRLGVGS